MFLRLLVSCVILTEFLNLLFISLKRVYKSNVHNFNLNIYIVVVVMPTDQCLMWLPHYNHTPKDQSLPQITTHTSLLNIVILITILFGLYLAFIIFRFKQLI